MRVIKSVCVGDAFGMKDEKFIQDYVGKPEGKRQVERLKHRQEDNIKMDFIK
jgi:hypothetical protein